MTKHRLPEIGDYVTIAEWGGDFYRVSAVKGDLVWLDYIDENKLINSIGYPLVNKWIFNDAKKDRFDMEDTRDYLEAVAR